MPGVVGVYLTGTPQKGVGPQDVALAIIGEVFDKGYVKMCIRDSSCAIADTYNR